MSQEWGIVFTGWSGGRWPYGLSGEVWFSSDLAEVELFAKAEREVNGAFPVAVHTREEIERLMIENEITD